MAFNRKVKPGKLFLLALIIHFGWVLMIFFIPQKLFSQDRKLLDSLHYVLETTRDNHQRVRTLVEISKEYTRHDLATSLRYAEKSLGVAQESRDDKLLIAAHGNMGYVCFYHGLLELAAQNYYQYRELNAKAGNSEGVLRAMINIAGIKLLMLDFNGARKDLHNILEKIEHENLNLHQDTFLFSVLPSIYNNLGVVYENLGEIPEAYEYYQRGISLTRNLPDQKNVLARLLNNLGKLYGEQGRIELGYEILNEALQIRFDINDRHELVSSYRNLAMFYYDRENFPQALNYSYSGLHLAGQVGSLQLLSNFSQHLFEHYNGQNQSDSALKYLKHFKEYNDQLRNEEIHKEITRMEVTAQFQERELIREQLQKRREQRFYYTGGLMFSVMLIMGLMAFLSRSRAKRLSLLNANMELEARNNQLEKVNLERELEVKNKELTTNVIYQINKNELLRGIIEKLLQLNNQLKPDQQEQLLLITRDMEKAREESVWEEFEMRFHNVHNEFYDKLLKEFPDLSLNERRLCSFLRLNMTTKEIHSITGQSVKSIDIARTRLRKKLNLTNSDTALSDFLSSF